MTKKRLVILVILLMMLSSVVMKASSQGEMTVTKYLMNEEIHYLEVKAPYEVEEIILEALDDKNEIVQYSVLKSSFSRKADDLNRYKYFYVTSNRTDFHKINKIRLYSNGSKEKKYIIEEMEEVHLQAPSIEVLNDREVTNLKIMTYNIHHGKNLLGRDTLNIIADLIKETDADIIGVQEADNGIYRSKFRDQMKYLAEYLSMYYVYGDNLSFLGGQYGNGILSKYPITSYENLLLPSKREQRGLLSATIDVHEKEVQFMVTHLGLNQAERIRQIDTIKKHMEIIPREIILMGDFNATPDTDEIRTLSKKMVDTGYVSDNNNQPTFDLPILSGRIDYIFLSPSIQLEEYNVIKSRASDHYPIVIDIALPLQ
ncbi:endonuclease/exonuclease/phosphatase family protein [Alkaliphilus peptidifermentans]|uniref:Metal-dependent hydrolase, endonuclease/exonuclease/phosphatase family n=1 Tax=Alkaliphilus peptidifermentans DSM 18978 TaxID=1120976 RepID=A0A1G5BVG7_9FIRM|nr:endonuclease/exonuclease/phosphatase family protein [Alkaliphilus peptidifermentans]SCX94188.1 Metal-dependent hydrolase, endonuclease/exonuclease/phosphatase family [Alkaliphilus peptidifermentans DSM 18978]